MKVLKPFDNYRAGDMMSTEDLLDQESRGNLPDLIKNGYIDGINPYVNQTFADSLDGEPIELLRQMAKEKGIRGYARMKKETLLKRLNE